MRSRPADIRVTRGRKSVPVATPLALLLPQKSTLEKNGLGSLTKVAPYQGLAGGSSETPLAGPIQS